MRIISGKYAKQLITKPQDHSVRPTLDRIRENLFNILENKACEFFAHKRVLDLFAGTGALGFEALSRGADFVTFVENAPASRALIQKTIENLNAQGTTRILRRDATVLGLIGTMKPFDIVFADPPYGLSLGEKAFIAVQKGGWAKKESIFILEEALSSNICLPDEFIEIDKRVYGQTGLYFYRLAL